MDKIDMSALAVKLLEYERIALTLEKLATAIKEMVLAVGKTQTVGNVRATYSQGRKTYDYHTPGQQASQEVISFNTKLVTDWRRVCEDAALPVTYTQADPSVSLKLLA